MGLEAPIPEISQFRTMEFGVEEEFLLSVVAIFLMKMKMAFVQQMRF